MFCFCGQVQDSIFSQAADKSTWKIYDAEKYQFLETKPVKTEQNVLTESGIFKCIASPKGSNWKLQSVDYRVRKKI